MGSRGRRPCLRVFTSSPDSISGHPSNWWVSYLFCHQNAKKNKKNEKKKNTQRWSINEQALTGGSALCLAALVIQMKIVAHITAEMTPSDEEPSPGEESSHSCVIRTGWPEQHNGIEKGLVARLKPSKRLVGIKRNFFSTWKGNKNLNDRS